MTAAVATAAPGSGDHQFLRAPEYQQISTNTAGATTVTGSVSAPEIDPASAMAGLTLMLGMLAVLRGRSARQH
jgi:hypothetical protein